MQDLLTELDEGDRRPCVDIFVGNAKYVGLLKTIGGVMHLLAIEDALDELARSQSAPESETITSASDVTDVLLSATQVDYQKTCFFIAPIGDAEIE